MREYSEEPVNQPDTGDRGQEHEPEVEEDVDLLIDDVQRKNTQSIVVLDGAGWPVFVKLTLGNFGEHFVHRISPGGEVLLGHSKDLSSKGGELVTQEHVREVDLQEDVYQVEKFTENKFHEVSSSS